MFSRLRPHLTYANVASSLALFIAFAVGTAWAVNEWTGANIQNGTLTSADYKNNNIQSADLKDNDVRSVDVANDSTGSGLTGNDVDDGSLTGADVAPESLGGSHILDGALGSSDVGNETLTGADIANQSGVDTCTHGTARLGERCVGVANEHHTFTEAVFLCANLELRLPTLGEATSLATRYDSPKWTNRSTSGRKIQTARTTGGQ